VRKVKIRFPNGEVKEYIFEGEKSVLDLVGDPKGGFVARLTGSFLTYLSRYLRMRI